jgi:hypothetical protein
LDHVAILVETNNPARIQPSVAGIAIATAFRASGLMSHAISLNGYQCPMHGKLANKDLNNEHVFEAASSMD